MAVPAFTSISPEEYLRLEREAEYKSEYHDGQVFAMSGGSLAHSRIPANLITALTLATKGGPCRVCTADIRVRVGLQRSFFYPDVTIYCGEPQLADDFKDTLLNPAALFEVLSKSSESYDRGLKFSEYRKIESLSDYVLVSQTEPKVEVFSRDSEGKWAINEYSGMDATCQLPGINCTVLLADLYYDIAFVDAGGPIVLAQP